MSERRTFVHRRIMTGALILAFVALPFSIKVCHAAIIAMLINWLFEGSWRSKLSTITQSILLQLTIALFLLQLTGLAFSENLAQGWFSVEKKIFLLLIPLALATSLIRLARRDLTLIFGGFIAGCLAGTIICLFSAGQQSIDPQTAALIPTSYPPLADGASVNWVFFSYTNLAGGISLHPTYFSLYLAFCSILIMSYLPSLEAKLWRAVAVLLILYFTIFIMLLSSRIIILGICVVYLFLIIKSIMKKRPSFGLVTGVISIVLIILLLLVNPITNYRGIKEIHSTTFKIEPGTHYATAAQIRVSLWWLAIKSLQHTNPLIGSGTGDVQKMMAATSAEFDITNIINSFDPHNQFLYTWLANGIPALLVLIACLSLAAWWSWTKRDLLVLGFLFLFCLVCMTESALELQKGIVFYALMSGLLFFHKHVFQNISVNRSSLTRVGQ